MAARSLNRVQLIGNIVRDAELRFTPQNTGVCSFTVATNRRWTSSDGQEQEQAEFTRCTAWGKLAENAGNLLKKGRRVYVEGRLQTRSWQDKEGKDQKSTEVVVDTFILLDAPRRSGESYQDENQSDENLAVNDHTGNETPVSELADDIPF